MECREVQDKLSAYIEGIVPPAEKALMDDHLEVCPGCTESLTDLKKTIEYVREIPEAEPPAWLMQKVMAQVRVEAEAAMEARKGIWEKLFHPLHVKLPLEAAGVIAIAVVTIYVFKGIQPEMQLGKAPLEGIRGPVISEVQKPVAPPSSEPESQKAISDKSIESKRVMPPGQPTLRRETETQAPLPAVSAPAERYEEPGPTAGAGVKGELTRQPPSPKEEASSAFDLAKEKDQWKLGASSAEREGEMAKRPSGKPVMQEKQEVGDFAPAPKENQVMPMAGMEAKKDESKLEPLPAAPGEEDAQEARAKQRSERRALSAAPAAKALAEKRETGIRLTLMVQDVNAARSETGKAVAELGGRIIETEPEENRILLTAELSTDQLEALLNKLKALGEVKGEDAMPEARQGILAVVRIEISGRPIE
jgi:hypothetical protein